jgi:hypothetical protein
MHGGTSIHKWGRILSLTLAFIVCSKRERHTHTHTHKTKNKICRRNFGSSVPTCLFCPAGSHVGMVQYGCCTRSSSQTTMLVFYSRIPLVLSKGGRRRRRQLPGLEESPFVMVVGCASHSTISSQAELQIAASSLSLSFFLQQCEKVSHGYQISSQARLLATDLVLWFVDKMGSKKERK